MLHIFHNNAVVRMVWLGPGVWWKCWLMWNDRNVKRRNDWRTESWVHWGVLLWRGDSHTAISSQRWNTNTCQHYRCWVCAFNKGLRRNWKGVWKGHIAGYEVSLAIIQTNTLLNLLFPYFTSKYGNYKRSHFRNSNFSKETKLCITFLFVQRPNLSPKTNQNIPTADIKYATTFVST